MTAISGKAKKKLNNKKESSDILLGSSLVGMSGFSMCAMRVKKLAQPSLSRRKILGELFYTEGKK